MPEAEKLNLYDYIRDVPDFPRPGIIYRDITPLLANASAFHLAVESMARPLQRHGAEEILGIESRGFIFGGALSQRLRIPFHMARKPGKLPRETYSERYTLEYGDDCLELHTDTIRPGTRYAVVDDLIATGGTASAVCRLTEKCGGLIACCCFLVELSPLNGRHRLSGHAVESLLFYEEQSRAEHADKPDRF